jgi:hypothetical protein
MNFNNSNQNTKDGRTITIKNFGNNDGGWDRISLQKDNPANPQTYELRNNNQIYAQRCYNFGVTCTSYTDIVVEGSRVDQLSDPQALQESFGLVKYR